MIGNCQCPDASIDHDAGACPNRVTARYLRGDLDLELCDACHMGGDVPVADLYDIVDRLEAGETVPLAEVERVTGPLPTTHAEALAALIEISGLTIDQLEEITGRDLTIPPDAPGSPETGAGA